MCYHIDMVTRGIAFGEPVVGTGGGQVDNILIKFHLSETNRSCWAQTWMACLRDGNANQYAISPSQDLQGNELSNYVFSLQHVFVYLYLTLHVPII